MKLYLALYNDSKILSHQMSMMDTTKSSTRIVHTLKDMTVSMTDDDLKLYLTKGIKLIMPDFHENESAQFILRHIYIKMRKWELDPTKLVEYSKNNLTHGQHRYITANVVF